MVRLDATVKGRVQGVGFRYFTIAIAERLGLVGFVRNTTAGAVEVVAEGERSALEELLADLRKGPASAIVEEVVPRWLPAAGEFHDFGVRFW